MPSHQSGPPGLKTQAPLSSANPAARRFQQVAGTPLDPNFWTLHNFVADLVLGCQEGRLAGTNPFEDEALFRVFNLQAVAQYPQPSR